MTFNLATTRDAIRGARSTRDLASARRAMHRASPEQVNALADDMIDARQRLDPAAKTRLTASVRRERGGYYVRLSNGTNPEIDDAGPFDEEIDATLAARRMVGDQGIVIPCHPAPLRVGADVRKPFGDVDANAKADL